MNKNEPIHGQKSEHQNFFKPIFICRFRIGLILLSFLWWFQNPYLHNLQAGQPSWMKMARRDQCNSKKFAQIERDNLDFIGNLKRFPNQFLDELSTRNLAFQKVTSTTEKAEPKKSLNEEEGSLSESSLEKYSIEADLIVIGKFHSLKKEEVRTTLSFADNDQLIYRVGTLEIKKKLLGNESLTHIPFAFPVQRFVDAKKKEPKVVLDHDKLKYYLHQIEEGEEGIFFLTRHHAQPFFTPVTGVHMIAKSAKDYAISVEKLTKIGAILANPKKYLTKKEKKEQQYAAGMLVLKYRSRPDYLPASAFHESKISKEETGLIFDILSEMNWDSNDQNYPNLYFIFQSLNLRRSDGWVYPRAKSKQDLSLEMNRAIRAWLKKNRDTYRIGRWEIKPDELKKFTQKTQSQK